MAKINTRQSYAQVTNPKVTNILKLKEDYSNLPAKKIKNIHRIINNTDKYKPHIKITIKSLLWKQIIVPIDKDNITKFMALSSIHIVNLHRFLKNIKSNIIADYIWAEPIDITIVTNKVATLSNLQIIENYVKNVENINLENIKTLRLPQSKSYLKIIGISYLMENTNVPIILNFIELIIKSNHISIYHLYLNLGLLRLYPSLIWSSSGWIFGMHKVGKMLRVWSIGASTLEYTLWPFIVQTWTLVFLSAKTAKNRIILLLLIKFKDWSALSAIVHTRVNISDISYGVVKQISKSTHPDLKQNIGNCVLTCLNALTAKAIIKLTPICALSGSINLIESSTWRSIKKS